MIKRLGHSTLGDLIARYEKIFNKFSKHKGEHATPLEAVYYHTLARWADDRNNWVRFEEESGSDLAKGIESKIEEFLLASKSNEFDTDLRPTNV